MIELNYQNTIPLSQMHKLIKWQITFIYSLKLHKPYSVGIHDPDHLPKSDILVVQIACALL